MKDIIIATLSWIVLFIISVVISSFAAVLFMALLQFVGIFNQVIGIVIESIAIIISIVHASRIMWRYYEK